MYEDYPKDSIPYILNQAWERFERKNKELDNLLVLSQKNPNLFNKIMKVKNESHQA